MNKKRLLTVMGTTKKLQEIDTFIQADGAVGGNWSQAWNIADNILVASPTLGINLMSNGDMETGDPPTGWNSYNATLSAETTIKNAGNQSLKIVGTGTSSQANQTILGVSINDLIYVEGYLYSDDGTTIGYLSVSNTQPATISVNSTAQSWVKLKRSTFVSAASPRLTVIAGGTGTKTIYADDMIAKKVTLATALNLKSYKSNLYRFGASVTTARYIIGGVAVNFDSVTNPQNGIIWYTNGDKELCVDKFVNGTRSNVVTLTYMGASVDKCKMYSPGDILEVRKDGTTYYFYYRGLLITTQTISDVTIISNKYHGLFASTSDVFFQTAYCCDYDRDPIQLTTGASDFTGKTYTSSQGIVCLRFDDGTPKDYTTTFPLLTDRNLVATFAPSRSLWMDGINDVSYSKISEFLTMQDNGMEIACHSKTHGDDPTSYAEFVDETKNAIIEMRLLRFKITSWVQPGTWDGANNMYNITTTDFYTTGEHTNALVPYVSNYQAYITSLFDVGGNQYNLPFAHPYGFAQYASRDLATLQAQVDACITNKTAIVFLFHSQLIDSGGENISLADFTAFLTYVQTKVTAGDIVNMTISDMIHATQSA